MPWTAWPPRALLLSDRSPPPPGVDGMEAFWAQETDGGCFVPYNGLTQGSSHGLAETPAPTSPGDTADPAPQPIPPAAPCAPAPGPLPTGEAPGTAGPALCGPDPGGAMRPGRAAAERCAAGRGERC